MYEQFAACNEEIDLGSFSIPAESIYVLVYDVICNAMPEAFHLDYNSFGAEIGVYVEKISLEYTMTSDEYARQLAACRAAAASLLQGIQGNDDLTDAQKALLIHDRLASFVKYGPLNDAQEVTYPEGKEHHDYATIRSCLIQREAVCQGYALTYGYLLDQVGIENYYVDSDVLNHAWNLIYIDGTPYFVDVTWDDPTFDVPGRVLHDNFLCSTAAFYATGHTADDYEPLAQDTRYDNAFWKTSESAFQLLDGEIYYADGKAQTIKRWSDGAVIRDVQATWPHIGGGYWQGNFTRLVARGDRLYYTQPDSLWALSPATSEAEKVYSLSYSDPAVSIYGMAYEEPNFKLYNYTEPTFPNQLADQYEIDFYMEPDSISVTSVIPSVLSVEVSDNPADNQVAVSVLLSPTDADNQEIRWESSDEEIALVQGNGLSATVTGLKKGTAEITATSPDGPSATITVTVSCAHAGTTTLTPAVASTCKTPGHGAYSTCDGCGVIIEGSNEPLPLDPDLHEGPYELRNAAEATEEAVGYTGDLYCACGALIVNGTPTALILEATDGAVTWEGQEEEQDLTLTAAAAEGDLIRVAIHKITEVGEEMLEVTEEDYAFENGALTLKDAFLRGLARGEYEVTFLVGGVVASAALTVTPYCSFRYGDANGDGFVTAQDIVHLKNYFANFDFETGESTVKIGLGADANGDDEVTVADIVRLKNYFAGFNYTTGKSTVELGV